MTCDSKINWYIYGWRKELSSLKWLFNLLFSFLQLKQMSTNAYFFHLPADFILSFCLWCVLGCFLSVLGCFWVFCGVLGVNLWTVYFTYVVNYMSAMSWRSVVYVEETGEPRQNNLPVIWSRQILSHKFDRHKS
jgi:hypothetical protein